MMVEATNSDKARFNMIEQQIRPWGVLDAEVLDLLSVVRREDYVPAAHRDLAFAEVEIPLKADALPGQTMLQPKLEARLLQELGLRKTDRVLEIGTGSGYMAALMAAKAEFVHTVEIDPELVEFARHNLQRAAVVNVAVDLGDGARGWELYAPYDVIVLSGSTPVLADKLLHQLKVGGRLLAIVGNAPSMEVQLIRRADEHAFAARNLFETLVAPLVNAPQPTKFVF